MQMNQERIREALQVLYEEGIKGYKPEYQDSINKWDAIGRACADVSSHAQNAANLMYSWLEDWNHHSVCAVLDWIFPKMHKMSEDSPAEDYLDTLKRVKAMIDRQSVTVFTDWNTETNEHNVKTFKVEVIITEL